jgi:hypothetical protein
LGLPPTRLQPPLVVAALDLGENEIAELLSLSRRKLDTHGREQAQRGHDVVVSVAHCRLQQPTEPR